LRQRETSNPLEAITPVTDAATVRALIGWTRRVHIAESLEEYAVALAQATRQDPSLHLGASPRATLQLVRAAKVLAALDGREYVVPDDISSLVIPVFAHRLLAARGVHRAGAQPVEAALSQIIARVPVPFAARV